MASNNATRTVVVVGSGPSGVASAWALAARGFTPVVIGTKLEWIEPQKWRAERDKILTVLESWRRDWESRDINRYRVEEIVAQGHRAWLLSSGLATRAGRGSDDECQCQCQRRRL